MVEPKKASTKIKKKRWFKLIAPKIFRESILGESYVSEPNQLIGKTIRTNLMNIIGDSRKQNNIVIFKVTGVKEDKATTEIIGYGLTSSLIKRLMRKGTERIDDSIILKTSDEKTIRLKTFMLTRGCTRKSVLTSIKKLSNDLLKQQIEKMSFNNLINDLISNKLQKALSQQLKKIHPLKVCEVREIKTLETKKDGQEKALIKEGSKVPEKQSAPEKKDPTPEKPKTTEKKDAKTDN